MFPDLNVCLIHAFGDGHYRVDWSIVADSTNAKSYDKLHICITHIIRSASIPEDMQHRNKAGYFGWSKSFGKFRL